VTKAAAALPISLSTESEGREYLLNLQPPRTVQYRALCMVKGSQAETPNWMDDKKLPSSTSNGQHPATLNRLFGNTSNAAINFSKSPERKRVSSNAFFYLLYLSV
jgi:hypothetical protein